MSKAPRIDWYPSDWIAATRHLSPEERAVYHDLLMMIYEAHGALKEDHKRLARVIGVTPKRLSKIISLLVDEGKLYRVDGFLTNERAENELKKRENVSEKARASAKARWAKERRKASQNNGTDVRTQCEGNAHEDAYHSPTANSSSRRARDPTLFDRVWERAGVSRLAKVPTYWMPPAAEMLVNGWRELGLSDDEILSVVDARMKAHGEQCPDGPKAFTRDMQRFAGQKAAPPLTPINSAAPQQRRTRADDRFARLAARFPDGAEERGAPDEEMAGDQGDDPPRSLLPPRAVGGG